MSIPVSQKDWCTRSQTSPGMDDRIFLKHCDCHWWIGSRDPCNVHDRLTVDGNTYFLSLLMVLCNLSSLYIHTQWQIYHMIIASNRMLLKHQRHVDMTWLDRNRPRSTRQWFLSPKTPFTPDNSARCHKSHFNISIQHRIDISDKRVFNGFLPEARFGHRVLSLPASVCVCVSVGVSVLCVNHLLVRAITRDPFKLGSPSLDQRCKRPWLRSLFSGGQLTLTFKVKFNQEIRIYPI